MYVEERTVDVHIRRLRKALQEGNAAYADLIQTVRGTGYSLFTQRLGGVVTKPSFFILEFRRLAIAVGLAFAFWLITQDWKNALMLGLRVWPLAGAGNLPDCTVGSLSLMTCRLLEGRACEGFCMMSTCSGAEDLPRRHRGKGRSPT